MNRTLDERTFAVYIMASDSGTLYIGMTNDLMRRVQEHKDGTVKGFTKRYKVDCLVHYELGMMHTAPSSARSNSRAGCAGRSWR